LPQKRVLRRGDNRTTNTGATSTGTQSSQRSGKKQTEKQDDSFSDPSLSKSQNTMEQRLFQRKATVHDDDDDEFEYQLQRKVSSDHAVLDAVHEEEYDDEVFEIMARPAPSRGNGKSSSQQFELLAQLEVSDHEEEQGISLKLSHVEDVSSLRRYPLPQDQIVNHHRGKGTGSTKALANNFNSEFLKTFMNGIFPYLMSGANKVVKPSRRLPRQTQVLMI
jgi:hypothetical protein